MSFFLFFTQFDMITKFIYLETNHDIGHDRKIISVAQNTGLVPGTIPGCPLDRSVTHGKEMTFVDFMILFQEFR